MTEPDAWTAAEALITRLAPRCGLELQARPAAGRGGGVEIACYELGRPHESQRRRLFIASIEAGAETGGVIVDRSGRRVDCADDDTLLAALYDVYTRSNHRTSRGVSTLNWR